MTKLDEQTKNIAAEETIFCPTCEQEIENKIEENYLCQENSEDERCPSCCQKITKHDIYQSLALVSSFNHCRHHLRQIIQATDKILRSIGDVDFDLILEAGSSCSEEDIPEIGLFVWEGLFFYDGKTQRYSVKNDKIRKLTDQEWNMLLRNEYIFKQKGQ